MTAGPGFGVLTSCRQTLSLGAIYTIVVCGGDRGTNKLWVKKG
jgi:hypothetical protein